MTSNSLFKIWNTETFLSYFSTIKNNMQVMKYNHIIIIVIYCTNLVVE